MPLAQIVNIVESSVPNGTTLTVNLPPSRTVGNLLEIVVGFYGGGTPACGGWTLDSVTASTASMRIAVFSRVCTGSETNTYLVTGFSDNDTRSALALEIQDHNGVHLTSTPAVVTASSGVWSVPDVSTTLDNQLVLTFFYTQSLDAPPSFAWSAGTVVGNLSGTGGTPWNSYEKAVSRVKASAGSVGALTVTRTGGSSDNAAVAHLSIKPSPGLVSHFDMHEGSGTTITDIIGGKVLTSASPNWAADGIKGNFQGPAVGPVGNLTEWTALFEVTINTDFDGGILEFGHAASSNPWFNYNTFQMPGPWPPDQFGSVSMGIGTRCKVAYVFTATDSKTYVNGVLSGTFANTHPVSLSNPGGGNWQIIGTTIGYATIHDVKFYDKALTLADLNPITSNTTDFFAMF